VTDRADTQTVLRGHSVTAMSPQPRAALEVTSSGRLCLFGEHSDWAADYGIHRGCCLVVGTDQSIKATVHPSPQFSVAILLPGDLGPPSGWERRFTCDWAQDVLLSSAQDETEFFRYCAGVAHEMNKRYALPHGLDIRIKEMDLPLKKGVSSSAAVCILIAKAFDQYFNLKLFPHELMEMAYLGERLTGSQCGRMDQACLYGKIPVLLFLEKAKQIRIEPIFPGHALHLFFVDLGGKKDTVEILIDLQNHYTQSQGLQTALGRANEQFVRSACQFIQAGDAKALGELMIQAQAVFDRDVAVHSPRQLDSPLLHELLSFQAIQGHIFGGKGVGSQGDGTAQFVAKNPMHRDQAIKAIEQAFPQMRCFPLTINSASTSEAVSASCEG